MKLELSIGDLVRDLRGRLLQGNPRAILNDLCIDSRRLAKGQFFWALKGERTEGHLHLNAALQAGAGGFVVEKEKLPESFRTHRQIPVVLVDDTTRALQDLASHHRTRHPIPLAAVTGSNGKTTTKEMLAGIAAQENRVRASPGNLNSQIGLPLALLELRSDDQICILEMGASGIGNIQRLAQIARPQWGVITNIGRAHLEFFGSLENTARAKWELIQSLPPQGRAILPAWEPLLKTLIKESPCPVTFFGEGPESEVRAQEINEDDGIEFLLKLGGEKRRVHLSSLGRFNVLNALAASACAWRMGIGMDAIQKGLEAFRTPAMRMTVRQHPSGAILVDDAYNANPDSMTAALESFCEHFKNEKRIAVLGSMLELGNDSRRLHQEVGKSLKHLPPLEVHLVGEESQSIAGGARNAGVAQIPVFHETLESLRQAILLRLQPGVAVLFKASRGIHLEELIQKL